MFYDFNRFSTSRVKPIVPTSAHRPDVITTYSGSSIPDVLAAPITALEVLTISFDRELTAVFGPPGSLIVDKKSVPMPRTAPITTSFVPNGTSRCMTTARTRPNAKPIAAPREPGDHCLDENHRATMTSINIANPEMP